MTNVRTLGLLLLCTGGIYASYLTQGVVQESLATMKFGPPERYHGAPGALSRHSHLTRDCSMPGHHKLFSRPYKPDECCSCRRFTHLKALNGVQSIACFLWAAILVALPFQRPPKGAKIAPWLAYWKPGISNSIGPALGTEALKNISYPAQASLQSVLQ